jgi:hypothetical protein
MDVAKVKLDDSVIKLIMFIIIVLVIIYYLNKGIDGLTGIFGESKERKEEQAKQAIQGIENTKINTAIDGKVSYNRETFNNLANKLYDANQRWIFDSARVKDCLLYTSDAADEEL